MIENNQCLHSHLRSRLRFELSLTVLIQLFLSDFVFPFSCLLVEPYSILQEVFCNRCVEEKAIVDDSHLTLIVESHLANSEHEASMRMLYFQSYHLIQMPIRIKSGSSFFSNC